MDQFYRLGITMAILAVAGLATAVGGAIAFTLLDSPQAETVLALVVAGVITFVVCGLAFVNWGVIVAGRHYHVW